MSKNTRLIIWAFDPFHGNKSDHTRTALYVENLARSLNAKIEPVFILSPNIFYFPMDYLVPPAKEDFIDTAEREMETILSQFQSKYFLAGKVLYEEAFTLRGTVNSFIKYARDRKATLIFSPTQARRGFPRFWLGSFTETLLMYSPVPVITVNPQVKGPLRFHTVIYPTDLSDASKATLISFLPLAKSFNAKIHLLHALQGFGTVSALASEGLSNVAFSYYNKEIKRIRAKREKQLQSWIKLCKRYGVGTTAEILASEKQVLDMVLKSAKKNHANLIAMATTSGPVENVMTGGITRQVVRYSEVPVWVMHQSTNKRMKHERTHQT